MALGLGCDPGVVVAAFLSFLRRVQLYDTGLSVSAARGKKIAGYFIIL